MPIVLQSSRVFVGACGCVILLSMLYGCNVSYEDADILEELSESVPELYFQEPEYTFIRNSARVVRVSAENSELFSARQEQRFHNIAFIESDTNNNTLNSGSANYGVYFIDSGNFELVGDVVFQSIEQDATVRAPYLLWDNREERLFGKEDEWVMVTRSSGTVMRGKNLNADLSNRIIEFENASGVILPDNDERNDPDSSGQNGGTYDNSAQDSGRSGGTQDNSGSQVVGE